jgi:hypothetical protein
MTPDEQLRLLAIVGFTRLIAAQIDRGEFIEAQMTVFDLEEQVSSLDWLIDKRIHPSIGDEPQQECFRFMQ